MQLPPAGKLSCILIFLLYKGKHTCNLLNFLQVKDNDHNNDDIILSHFPNC